VQQQILVSVCFLVVPNHVDHQREKRVEVSVTFTQGGHIAVVDVYWELQKFLKEPKLFALDKLDKAKTTIGSGFHVQT
jgi:hypothetical protein